MQGGETYEPLLCVTSLLVAPGSRHRLRPLPKFFRTRCLQRNPWVLDDSLRVLDAPDSSRTRFRGARGRLAVRVGRSDSVCIGCRILRVESPAPTLGLGVPHRRPTSGDRRPFFPQLGRKRKIASNVISPEVTAAAYFIAPDFDCRYLSNGISK